MEHQDLRPIKKIRLKYQSSPRENPKLHVITYTQKGKKLLFDDEVGRQPSNEVSQMKMVRALGGETLADKDMTEYKWAMQYVDSNKKVVLLIAKNKGHGHLDKNNLLDMGIYYD